MKKEDSNKFIGFPKIGEPGTFWLYPEIMDYCWCALSGSEQKVLDFLLRRTFGFQKTKDKISIGQFANGVRGCDYGTGLSERTIIRALSKLEKKGFIRVRRSGKNTLEKEINEYRLVMTKKRKGDDRNSSSGDDRNADRSTGTINSSSINRDLINRAIREIHTCYRENVESGAKLTDGARNKITERLSDENKFTPEELKQAILNFSQDGWWMDKNGKKGMWWFFRYPDRVEFFKNMNPQGYFEN